MNNYNSIDDLPMKYRKQAEAKIKGQEHRKQADTEIKTTKSSTSSPKERKPLKQEELQLEEKHKYIIAIPGKPIPKGRPRFNAKTGHAYTPERTHNKEKEIKLKWQEKYKSGMAKGVLKARMYFAFEPPKGDSKKKRNAKVNGEIPCMVNSDVDNLAKLVLDALNKVAFEDDKQIIEITARKGYEEESYTVVEIEEL